MIGCLYRSQAPLMLLKTLLVFKPTHNVLLCPPTAFQNEKKRIAHNLINRHMHPHTNVNICIGTHRHTNANKHTFTRQTYIHWHAYAHKNTHHRHTYRHTHTPRQVCIYSTDNELPVVEFFIKSKLCNRVWSVL